MAEMAELANMAAFLFFPVKHTHSLPPSTAIWWPPWSLVVNLAMLKNAKLAKTANMAMSAIMGDGGHVAGNLR